MEEIKPRPPSGPLTGQKVRKRKSQVNPADLPGPSSEAGPSTLPSSSKSPAKDGTRNHEKRAKHPHGREHQAHQRGALDPSSHWDAVPIAENQVSRIPPIWSRDGKFYFTVSGTSVNIHSASPPAYPLLSTLSGRNPHGHRRNITSLVLHPTNPMQLLTAAEDGLIKIWDWVEGRLVRTIKLNADGKVRQICVGQIGGKWQIFATAETEKENKSKQKGPGYSWKVLRTPLNPSPGAKSDLISDIGKLSFRPSALLISPRSTYLVALSGSKAYTYRLPTEIPKQWIKPTCVKFVSDQDFTCGAFAPERIVGNDDEEEWFATGDVKGVVRLWHGLTAAFRQIDIQTGSNDQQPSQAAERRLPTTSLHWHAHAVGALAFTPSGAQILSVGEESVLVQWHLASGRREYLPRLGGRPIISLAVKPGARGVEEEWWIRNLDGSVLKIGGNSGQILNVGQGVRLDPLRPKEVKHYPFALHPPTKSLVVPSSHPSTVQFIDPLSSTVLFDLEVAPSNRITRRDERELEPVSVEHIAFNDVTEGGNRWMATVEGRTGDELEGGGFVKTLKIWKWNGEKYTISTQYPRPHGTSEITSIAFIPSPTAVVGGSTTANSPYLLTTSIDGVAKLWNVRQSKRIEQGKSGKKSQTLNVELFWAMRSSFSYRSLPIYSATFSPDSSILALAHGPVITIWDFDSNVLLQALDGGLSDCQRVGFVGQEGRYLACSGKECGLVVWDLLSCEVTWSNTTAHCEHILTSASNFFIVTEPSSSPKQTHIATYTPTSSKPTRRVLMKAKIRDLLLLPTSSRSNPKAIQFVGVSQGGEISRFGDDIAQAVQTGANKVTGKGEKKTSIWQEMFGKDAVLEVEDQSAEIPVEVVRPPTGRPTEVFEGASHTLPPVSLLFDAFMEEILVPRSAVAVKEDRVEEGIVYDVSEDVSISTLTATESAGREVGDDEVKELESFFRDLLSAQTAKSMPKPKSLPNGHAATNGRTHLRNGHANSDDEMDVERPDSIVPKSKSTPSRTPNRAPGDEPPEVDGEEVAASGGGKGRGKKRKAPRESTAV